VKEKVPLFEQSDDWEIMFDLDHKDDGQGKNRPFPPHVAASPRRPDGVMYSNKLKHVMWIELTSPWEDNFDTSYLRNKGRYNKLEKLKRWLAGA